MICGKRASYKEIEDTVYFVYKDHQHAEKEEIWKKTINLNFKKNFIQSHQTEINFWYFEVYMRKYFKKQGIKLNIKKWVWEEEVGHQFVLSEDKIAGSINRDFKHYVKCFIQYNMMTNYDIQFK